jgi:SOS-response transcriptional repressor LexA
MNALAETAAELIRTDPALAHEILRQMRPSAAGGLTGRQRDALEFIRGYHAENGITPTFEEICVGLGLGSKSGVHRLITGLEERGVIERIPGRARSIVLKVAA